MSVQFSVSASVYRAKYWEKIDLVSGSFGFFFGTVEFRNCSALDHKAKGYHEVRVCNVAFHEDAWPF
jgi:hypothetical protein